MTIPHAIQQALPRLGDKTLVRDGDTELSASDILAATRAAAGRLSDPSVSKAVGLLLPNCAGYPAAILGALWAGKTAVPLNPMLKPNEIAFLLEDAQINTVVVAPPTKPLVAGLNVNVISLSDLLQPSSAAPASPAEGDIDETAVMLYTSGTSGKPKGVPLTHQNLLSNAQSLINHAGLTDRDVFLGVLPMFHAFGLTGTMIMPLLLGAEVTYLRFTPERVAAEMAERKTTIFVAVPGMFGLLARLKGADEGLRKLNFPVAGGEALPPTIREGFEQRFGRPLFEGYGLTETAPVIAVNIPGANRPGTVGRVAPGVKVRIADEAAQPRPTGEEGEIQVSGPNVMKGYYNRPDENAAAFTADGWFRTGDLGRLDADGFLSISGRIKEIIIRAGEKIMPREVEEVLARFPGVQEAAVIGEPDGDRGEAVIAFIVPAAGASPTPEALREHCRGRLAEFKVPRRYNIAADLPRGATGKLLKRALKDWKG